MPFKEDLRLTLCQTHKNRTGNQRKPFTLKLTTNLLLTAKVQSQYNPLLSRAAQEFSDSDIESKLEISESFNKGYRFNSQWRKSSLVISNLQIRVAQLLMKTGGECRAESGVKNQVNSWLINVIPKLTESSISNVIQQ